MNDIFEETFGKTNTEKQTPIEIALGVDAQGMTTAKRLYAFLEKEGIAPYKIAEAFKMVSEQFGILLPDDFVKVPEYEQMDLSLK